MVNKLRQSKIKSFIDESIDFTCQFIFQHAPDHYAIHTTGDGNCLFHATSISVFGDETKSYIIKLYRV